MLPYLYQEARVSPVLLGGRSSSQTEPLLKSCSPMSSFRSEPILWIHVAGLAVVPIFLELCLLGLAVSDPAAGMVGAIYSRRRWGCAGALDAVKPPTSSPFAIALKQEQLSSQQRKILSLINTRLNRVLAVVAAVFLVECCGNIVLPHLRACPISRMARLRVAKRSIAFG